MATGINTYLHFEGNCEEAFTFYRSVFGGEFAMLQRFKDAPGMNAPAAMNDKILHVSLPVGGGNLLMGSDSMDHDGWTLKPGNNFSLSLNADSRADADRVCRALSTGGKVTMPMSDQFWGAYFGMCTDKFGVQWMISYQPPK